MIDLEKYFLLEWKNAEKEGDTVYANACKEEYESIVRNRITQDYQYTHKKLKRFPFVYLN